MDKQVELMIEVCRYYYEQNLTQGEIGKRINASRSTVSRLLQQALEKKIVKISIDYPWERAHEMEERLTEKFRLRDARVLCGQNRKELEILDGMGVLAARLIDSYVKDGTILGVSYGRSLASTIKALPSNRKVDLTVIPIIGALGSNNALVEGPDIVRQISQAYGGGYRYLPVPLVVDSIRTRDSLVQSPQIFETLAIARKSNVVLLGIGSVDARASSLIWSGYINEPELSWLNEQGAVGHMCGQFFDINGTVMDVELNQRSIGIGINTLHNIDPVIAVAGGEAKTKAILGALRGKFLNILITDDIVAKRILEYED